MSEASPEAHTRAAYLQTLLKVLCRDIGPRWAGTDADRQAARLVERELRERCDRVEVEPFSISYWMPLGSAWLKVGNRKLECFPHFQSPSTGDDGIRGRLASDPNCRDRFRIASDTARDDTAAYLVLGPFGKAVPRFDADLIQTALPVVGVSRHERAYLEAAAEQGTEAQLHFAVTTEEGVRTQNVIGRIQGATEEEIVIVAHYDSQYNSPGANDNAATLIVMLQLAEHFFRARPRYSLTFLASGAEEVGFRGATHFVEKRREEGTLENVKLCMNFDSLTYGKHPHISTVHDQLAASAADAFRALHPDVHPQHNREDDTLDGAPFVAHGIPTLFFNSRGDDDSKVRLWHRPEDVPESVDPELPELYYHALVDFISNVRL